MTCLLLASTLGLESVEPASIPALPPGVSRLQWESFNQAHPGAAPGETKDALLRRETAWGLARREGLLRDRSWSAFKAQLRRQILGGAYLKALPGHGAVSETQAQAIYLGQGEERRVWHLLRPDRESAEKALGRLRAGEDPGALAAELSVDPSGKQNRGEVGWLRKEQVVPAFGEAVFGQAPGTLLGPLQTEFGWHLAKALEARRPTAEGWTRERAAFTAKLESEQQTLKRSSAMRPLRERFPLGRDIGVLGRDRTTMVAPGDDKLVAGRVVGKAITLAELKVHLQGTLGSSGGSHSLGADTKGDMLEGLADGLRLEAAATAQGLHRRPSIQAALWNGERDEALARVAHWHLERLKIPDEELEAHRLRHPTRFLGPGSLQLHQLTFVGQDQADQARSEADQGAAWATLFQRYADQEATGAWDLGWTEVSSLRAALGPATVAQLQKAPDNQVIGPVPGPDGPMLFKVLARRPGPPLTLDEGRDAVRQDYLREVGDARVRVFLESQLHGKARRQAGTKAP